MNKITLIGFVGKDAETRQTQNGNMVAKIQICTDDGYFDKGLDKWIKKDNWHTIIAWRKLADKVQHVKKGWKVFVEGRLTSRIWEKEDGSKQTVVEIEAFKIEQLVHQPKESNFPTEPQTNFSQTPTPPKASIDDSVELGDNLPF